MVMMQMSKNKLKIYRSILIIIDVLAIIQLLIQITFKEMTYVNHILLIILNIVLFTIKPNDKEPKNN